MDQDEVIAISSDMFPSLQEFRLGYIERQVDITMRSNMLLSQVFSKEWRCLEAAELPFITDIMAFQIAKTCPKLKTLKAEICYNFSLPDPVEFGQWRHNDTVDIAWVGEYVLTNRGFLAIVQSCKNLFRLQIGLYSASHSHLLDQGIVFETSGANNDSIAVSRIWPTQPHLQPGEAVFAHDLPGVLVMPLEERQAQQAPDVRHHAHIDANDISIVPWACKDLVSLKLRELWFPTDTYAILLRQLPYLCNCIFEITDMDESVPLTAQGWETHKFMYEIEIRFRAQSSSWFCRQLFDLLPNLRVVYLSNYNADEKDLKRDYPYLTIRKRQGPKWVLYLGQDVPHRRVILTCASLAVDQ
ncbi:hypothetical protein EV182_002403 [Spiromyces aspiralis]|uniref:Uncharacterized protein n=1 Tax=Spiromyces aspiralis TaxID=68401 RepID=A0ACC1HU26_9FUNG|nr:hypothetical protein EV182_002403 [Spiromyces aspiralis]